MKAAFVFSQMQYRPEAKPKVQDLLQFPDIPHNRFNNNVSIISVHDLKVCDVQIGKFDPHQSALDARFIEHKTEIIKSEYEYEGGERAALPDRASKTEGSRRASIQNYIGGCRAKASFQVARDQAVHARLLHRSEYVGPFHAVKCLTNVELE